MRRLPSLCTIGDGIDVRTSSIPKAGNGLFASKSFSRGSYITLYDGETVSWTEAWRRPCLTHMASKEGVIVDGLKVPIMGRGGGSFINSSKLEAKANAKLVAWLGLLMIRAKKQIDVDDEITIYYGRRGFEIAMGNVGPLKQS